MAKSLSRRLPPGRDLLYFFAVCVLPINLWSMINLLQHIPAWVLRFNTWDLLGAAAYTQVFALFEILVVFLFMVILASFFPGSVIKVNFFALSSLVVILASAWTVIMHRITDCCDAFSQFGAGDLALLLFGYLISFVLAYALIRFDANTERAMRTFVERIAVLSAFYVALDLISVAVVVIRNV